MKSAYDVIRRIVVTEKSMRLQAAHNQYFLNVDPRANKQDIRDAVQRLFGVKVEKVNTLRREGKRKRDRSMKAKYGRTSAFKRAIVTLKEGDKIELAV
jgi:large subunit ribosomal protein L23